MGRSKQSLIFRAGGCGNQGPHKNIQRRQKTSSCPLSPLCTSVIYWEPQLTMGYYFKGL